MRLRLFITALCCTTLFAACADRQTTGDAPTSAPRAHDPVLIPGGEFVMGKDGESDYSPAHTVRIDSFYIDRYEVTNAQYFEFCESTGAKLPEFWEMGVFNSGPDYPNHPVVGISWGDAKAYAEWRGMRLPTEAEWEYAGRGGLVGMNYAIGDTIDSTNARYTMEGVSIGTVPVGSYPPNGYGLHDMSGNVSEWIADYYGGDYYAVAPAENPTGPEKGKFRIFRGGGWHSGPFCNRVYFRNALPSGFRDYNVGFRCAQDMKPVTSPE